MEERNKKTLAAIKKNGGEAFYFTVCRSLASPDPSLTTQL
jgi:hypothetical protein